MDIQAKKLNLIEWLVTLQDESVINKMFKYREKLAHNPSKRMAIDELLSDLEQSEKARKSGRVTDIEELRKESANW